MLWKALVENLKTGNGRIYNDATVQQVLEFHFAENRQNVGIYGVTGAGKSYFLSACCVEACRRNYRCKFVDYSDLLDELIVLNRQKDLNRYRKRIKYYARIQLLFIDDFAISRYSEEGIKILYHLLKLRDDLGTSTLLVVNIRQMNGESNSVTRMNAMENWTVSGDALQQDLQF